MEQGEIREKRGRSLQSVQNREERTDVCFFAWCVCVCVFA